MIEERWIGSRTKIVGNKFVVDGDREFDTLQEVLDYERASRLAKLVSDSGAKCVVITGESYAERNT